MFKINHDPIVSKIPIISNNYRILHFDEDPILFTGTNQNGAKIIGSFVDDDDNEQVTRNFHVLVNSKQYYDFLKQRISYLDILKECNEIFIIDKHYSGGPTTVYIILFSEIPSDYLPAADSLCPEQEFTHDLGFTLSLKGLLADLNTAIPKRVSKIQTVFAEWLESTLDLKNFNLSPQVVLIPSTSGSFRINFNVKLFDNDSQISMFTCDDKIAKYLNDFLQYCFSSLNNDIVSLLENNFDNSTAFKKLVSSFEDIYKAAQLSLPDKMDEVLLNELKKSVEKVELLTEHIGSGFSHIDVLKTNEFETPIGYLDLEFKNAIEKTVNYIDQKTGELTVDTEFTEYKINIYHLNTLTRTGNANIYDNEGGDEMSKPRIKIIGENQLEETKFAESLYLNKWITVKAKATKKGAKFQKLEITPDY